MTDTMPSVRRRTVLVGGGLTMVSLAGCLGGSEPGGPQHHSYTLTLTRSGEALELRIEPAGEVEDVIQVRVGDAVEFTIENDAGVPVGVHNHANDAEIVIEPGDERTMEFEATEAMTGRQVLEGWVVEAGDGADGHGEEATELAIIEVRPEGS